MGPHSDGRLDDLVHPPQGCIGQVDVPVLVFGQQVSQCPPGGVDGDLNCSVLPAVVLGDHVPVLLLSPHRLLGAEAE